MSVPEIRESLSSKQKTADEKIKTIEVRMPDACKPDLLICKFVNLSCQTDVFL